MDASRPQISLMSLLAVVACVAANLWLFRLGTLWGLIGLNITRHVLTASLCRLIGLDRREPSPADVAPVDAERPGPPGAAR